MTLQKIKAPKGWYRLQPGDVIEGGDMWTDGERTWPAAMSVGATYDPEHCSGFPIRKITTAHV